MSHNVFLTTTPGLEKGLKAEVKLRFPAWRPAFSAPGFLTYVTEREYTSQELALAPLIFARLRGPVHGKLGVPEAMGLGGPALSWAVRDLTPLSVAPMELTALSVVDLIRIDEGHVLKASHLPGPWAFMGDRPFISPFELPPEAPSRAYLKFKEACAFAGSAPRPGERVLELGSSPGGASYALLSMGAHVIGVDTGPMHPSCTNFKGPARFTHLPIPMQKLTARELRGDPITWLVCDVNLRPMETWEQLERLLKILGPGLGHLVWTVKMTHWEKVGEFLSRFWPSLQKSLLKAGAKSIRCAFLPSHHREFLVWADF